MPELQELSKSLLDLLIFNQVLQAKKRAMLLSSQFQATSLPNSFINQAKTIVRRSGNE
jgi:hypothetical protein